MSRKNIFFISLIFVVSLMITGCEAESEEVVKEAEEEQGKLVVHQVLPDGSKEEIMVIGEDKMTPTETTETSEPALSVIRDVKGVLISEEGFTPSDITIRPGLKIIFDNQGEQDHWPVSGEQEEDEVCPEFNLEEAIKPGDTKEILFSEVKECPFHGRLNAKLKGKVVVKEEE